MGLSTFLSPITHTLTGTSAITSTPQQTITQDALVQMAGNPYADGNLPLGDKKYVTDAPKQGYIYLCNVQTSTGGGAQKAGPWIHGNTWNYIEKIAVNGHVSWPTATFSNSVNGDTRTLSGNDLPNHNTGIFPIASTDPASAYDKNPNSIKPQNFTLSLPVTPTYSDIPHCMGGEVGVMLTGVALFNGFDAEYRDAAANEVQDSCDGHPQESGEYHYHSLSSCITDTSETTIIGYALDGFPITGPKVAEGKYLTTANLDECHGITSEIMVDGNKVVMYHYVMTQDFPYSVSCFRGQPVSMQVMQQSMQQGQGQQGQQGRPGMTISGQPAQITGQPPQAAITACTGVATGTTCSFAGPRGTITGTCQTPPNQKNMICVPSNTARPQGTCTPRPACLNAKPPCMIAVTSNMCPQ